MAEIDVTGEGSVVAEVGDELVIRLAENGTTGYLWSIRSLGPGLRLVGDMSVPPGLTGPGETERAGPGASGERLITVRTGQPGRVDIVLELHRSWEPDAVDSRTYTVITRAAGERSRTPPTPS